MIKRARNVLDETGGLVIGFLISLVSIMIIIGLGVDASVRAHFADHMSNSLTSATRNSLQYIYQNGKIDAPCAYGAFLESYSLNKNQMASSVNRPAEIKSGNVLASGAGGIGISPMTCAVDDFNNATSWNLSASNDFVITKFDVTQPEINGTSIKPGQVTACVREKHRTFFLGMLSDRFRAFDLERCSTAVNLVAIK